MTGRAGSQIATAALAALLVVAALAAPAVAQSSGGQAPPAEDRSSPGFAVAVQPDGTGQVAVTYTFDLTDEDRAAAFRDLRNSENATADFRKRFRNRMAAVATDAQAATGREMAVRDVAVSFKITGDTGVATVSLTWDGLAAAEGDRLTVTEPFASGFTSDRPVHLYAPDDYEVTAAEPAPREESVGQLTWAAGTDLSGFEAVLTPTDDGGSTDGGSGPGFGHLVAVLALLAAVALAVRRQ